MRILAIITAIILCIGIDSATKWYWDDIAWQKYCYSDSIEAIPDNLNLSSQTNRLIGNCFQNIDTGSDFYASVYKDIYSPIFGEYLGFQLSYNRGVAFSLPITGLPLQILTIILVMGLIWYYFSTEYIKRDRILDIGYILILAGALSHAYERIFTGYVVDFIAIKYFAILNFADIFISIGACFIIFVYYVRKSS